MSDVEETPVDVAAEVEETEVAPSAKTGGMSIEDALQEVCIYVAGR